MPGTTPLIETLQKKMASDGLHLPMFHHVALKLQGVLAQDDFDINQVAAMITEDQALASQTLRVANSAFFAGLSKVSTIREAIVRLGARQVANLVMLITQQATYRSSDKTMGGYMYRLWKHALGCAMGTKWLAEKTGLREMAQEALLAGLLHDIGKLFILKVLEEIQASHQEMVNLSDAVILEVLDLLHAEQGCLLMQQWNIPDIYCTIARDHHREVYDTSDALLTLVRLVDLTCKKIGVGLSHEPTLVLAYTPEAQVLGTPEVVLAELEIMIEDTSTLFP
jgi:HD-like signal output (HDOD) protein